MTNIDLNKAYVVLWSARTRSLQVEGYAQMIEKNVRAYHNKTGSDYICLGVFESAEIAKEKSDTLENRSKTST